MCAQTSSTFWMRYVAIADSISLISSGIGSGFLALAIDVTTINSCTCKVYVFQLFAGGINSSTHGRVPRCGQGPQNSLPHTAFCQAMENQHKKLFNFFDFLSLHFVVSEALYLWIGEQVVRYASSCTHIGQSLRSDSRESVYLDWTFHTHCCIQLGFCLIYLGTEERKVQSEDEKSSSRRKIGPKRKGNSSTSGSESNSKRVDSAVDSITNCDAKQSIAETNTKRNGKDGEDDRKVEKTIQSVSKKLELQSITIMQGGEEDAKEKTQEILDGNN